MTRVDGLVRDQKHSGIVATPEEALRSLLRGGAPYDWRPSNETLASYQADLVSLPDNVGRCPLLRDVLPPDDCRYLEEQSELMLADDAGAAEGIEPYWDPALRFNKKNYNNLVLRLRKIGYFQYTTQPKCKVEFDGEVFASPEAISKLTAFIGLSDVKDCFHRLRVPMWIARFFAWEAVPAKTVGLENTYADGKFVGPLDPVFPCAGSLCQGFSWSLYFAQKANEYLSKTTPLLAQARLLHDRGDPLVLHVGRLEDEADHFYMYVDNLGVVGTNHERVVEAMDALQQTFDGLGLELHGSEVSCGSVEALGCIIEGNKLRSRIAVGRLWKVHQAVEGLLRRVASHSARESVLLSAGLVLDAHGRWTAPHDEECREALAQAGWGTDSSFKEVPAAGLKRRLWQPTMHGNWEFSEDILVLEVRAVMKGIKRALLTRFGHDIRQLALCDNLAAVLTFERCRSRNYKVLKVLRQFGAYCFARNVRVSLRWIPSELNIADEGSRIAEGAKDSKLLIDLLGDSWADDFVADVVSPSLPLNNLGECWVNESQTDTHIVSNGIGSQSASGEAGAEPKKDPCWTQGRGSKCANQEWPEVTSPPGGWPRIKDGRKVRRNDEAPRNRSATPSDTSHQVGKTRRIRREREHLVRVQGRQRRRERALVEKQTKARVAAVFHLGQGHRSHSLLEEAAVSAKVRQSYSNRLRDLQAFVREARMAFETDEQIDEALVEFFNAKFKEGEGSSVGDYTLAALMDKIPQFGRLGNRKACLPPGCVVRDKLAHGSSWVSTYHRPGTLLKLRKLGLVKPTRGVTNHWSVVTSLAETSDISKTGTKDDSVLVDSQWMAFANPLLEELARGDKMEFVFKFDYTSYLKVFREACQDLRLQLVPYQARHSGPSIDRAKNVRTQEEVRKRGNWQSRQSVARYEKAGRLAATWQKLDVEVQMACQAVMLGQAYPVSWELNYGRSQDLTDLRVLSKIKFDIRRGFSRNFNGYKVCNIAEDDAEGMHADKTSHNLPNHIRIDYVIGLCVNPAFLEDDVPAEGAEGEELGGSEINSGREEPAEPPTATALEIIQAAEPEAQPLELDKALQSFRAGLSFGSYTGARAVAAFLWASDVALSDLPLKQRVSGLEAQVH
ncbi:SLC34A1 [Symbiodinium pilosum]|uniref:SLC34A1 protein n=1 Tax=Symbiodinium pilosum TaxID=2952 RepID=A0A812R5S0_SYMPI|nr:SLC34A1 [Symbiodinium pilosum]